MEKNDVMDEEQLYSELDQLVEDYVNGVIPEDEYYEMVRRINEELRDEI